MRKINSNENDRESGEVLTGGRVTQTVVRVENTVRRTLSKNAKFVHLLLEHLEKVGFKGAPKFLGIDESNREILTYIEGFVPPDLDHWSDEQLIAAAKLIRQYHDATMSFEPKNGNDVICHNDLSPCNTIMNQGLPIALIDFDEASPGSRVNDLAYAVWLWCDLGNEVSPNEQARRIKLMCDSYGIDNKDFILDIIKVQKRQIEKFKMNVDQGLTHWNDALKWGEKCLQWVITYRQDLEKELNY